jgi:hypothetical protein
MRCLNVRRVLGVLCVVFAGFVLVWVPTCSGQFTTDIVGESDWWAEGDTLKLYGPDTGHSFCCCPNWSYDCNMLENPVFAEVATDGNCNVTDEGTLYGPAAIQCDFWGAALQDCIDNPDCEEGALCGTLWVITDEVTCGGSCDNNIYTIQVLACRGDGDECWDDPLGSAERCDNE